MIYNLLFYGLVPSASLRTSDFARHHKAEKTNCKFLEESGGNETIEQFNFAQILS